MGWVGVIKKALQDNGARVRVRVRVRVRIRVGLRLGLG